MSNTYFIQKLIFELELDSEQEYHRVASHIQSNLYEPLLQEIDSVLSEYLKDENDHLVIDKLEVELDPFFIRQTSSQQPEPTLLPVEELLSQKLVVEVKNSLSETLKTATFTHEVDKDKPLQIAQDAHEASAVRKSSEPKQDVENDNEPRQTGRANTKPEPEVDDSAERRNVAQEKGLSTEKTPPKRENLTPTYRTSKLESLKHYLLTGQFLIGVELSAQEATQLVEQAEAQTHLTEWVKNLPSSAQQYRVLKRVAWQFPPKVHTPLFQDPAIETINQSFAAPISISQQPENIQKDQLLNAPSEAAPQETVSASHQTSSQSELQEEQAYYVKNAGIVIIAPYLPSFFQKSGLLDDTQKAFKNEQAVFYAIHLLEYLTNKSTVETENNAWLNKLLCGLPLSTPIPTQIDIDESDKALSTRLLLQVSRKWNIKIGEKIDYLRGSFFIRDGKLTPPAPSWVLTVDAKIYDSYLFKKLPWSFKRVQLPWMEKWLLVDWD